MVLEEVSSNSHYRLSKNECRSVSDLRSRVVDQLSDRYDTDYNLYRWIRFAERTTASNNNKTSKKIDQSAAVLDGAEKLLRNHLRYRKALNLDSDSIPCWDDNPLHERDLIPHGRLHYVPSSNRYLLWVDYREIMDGVLKSIPSRELVTWNFWLYEAALRIVNERERTSGALSGVFAVVDVGRMSVTPGLMRLAKNGYMTYTAHLFHYEHFPELIFPFYFINTSKLLTIPYRLCQRFMPHDFTDRYRVHDSSGSYARSLLADALITDQELPEQLGGRNPDSDALAPIPTANTTTRRNNYSKKASAGKFSGADYDQNSDDDDALCHFSIPAGKRKFLSIECKAGDTLHWWLKADAEVTFGIYYYLLPTNGAADSVESIAGADHLLISEELEMVSATFLLLCRITEQGRLTCEKTGTYCLLFCNKRSWFYGRKIQTKLEINGRPYKELREMDSS